jgi:zinc transport system ATP-binding protein
MNENIKGSKVDHTQNIIEIDNVTFSYGKETVLENVSLKIHKGDYIGLIGPNGGGKTTLLKVVLGLLPLQKGTIRLFGENVDKFDQWNLIGYVAQRSGENAGNFPVTVWDVVGMARGKRLHPLDETDETGIKRALEYVGMWEQRNKLIGELSGGQQQRVFIARALVNDPQVIFMDEPTAGVDEKTQDDFFALLQKLNREKGITLVLVSHDIARLTGEVMHIACVDHNLICHLSPEEYLEESETANILGKSVKIITHHHHNHG